MKAPYGRFGAVLRGVLWRLFALWVDFYEYVCTDSNGVFTKSNGHSIEVAGFVDSPMKWLYSLLRLPTLVSAFFFDSATEPRSPRVDSPGQTLPSHHDRVNPVTLDLSCVAGSF